MIRLKQKINKSELQRNALKEAERRYANSFCEVKEIWAFTDAVKWAIEQIRDKK